MEICLIASLIALTIFALWIKRVLVQLSRLPSYPEVIFHYQNGKNITRRSCPGLPELLEQLPDGIELRNMPAGKLIDMLELSNKERSSKKLLEPDTGKPHFFTIQPEDRESMTGLSIDIAVWQDDRLRPVLHAKYTTVPSEAEGEPVIIYEPRAAR